MEEKTNPYIGFEGALYRMDKMNKRLWILCIVLIVLFMGSNIAWLKYEHQFQDISTSVSQEIDGDNVTNTGIGEINYGKDKTDNNSNEAR